jgi:N-acetylglucosamine-6-sulfatase
MPTTAGIAGRLVVRLCVDRFRPLTHRPVRYRPMPRIACRPPGARRAAPFLAATLAAAIACTGGRAREVPPSSVPETPPTGATEPAPARPDIVLVLTDDQRWDELASMPSVQRLLVAHGTTFTNAFTTDPLCCPSRASILTGTYPHTTGVYRNSGRHGGWAAFRGRAEASTIATWLQDGGYRTAMFGKYFNGYRTTQIPPGWDRIMALTSPGPGYVDYAVNDDGTEVRYGTSPADYATDVFARGAVDLIRTTPEDQPLFVYFAPSAPHLPALPAPRHEVAGVGTPVRSPAVNEADVSDKPAHMRALGQLPQGVLDEVAVRRARSLLAVDDAVADMVGALRRAGRLGRTLFVFASDNGVAIGEHRWRYKLTPYEESIRIPLVVRYDAIDAPPSIDLLALNIDLAPTFADVAGITPSSPVEGKSMLPLLRGHDDGWRRDFLIENLFIRRGDDVPVIPTYCGVRTARWKLVHYDTGELELYDLAVDPYELENLARVPVHDGVIERLDARLRTLCDPPPPGFSF